MSLSSQLSLWNTGGGFNESFNSFLTGAVIELNSHRRAGSSTHHKPFPPIRDVTETAGREAGQSEIKKKNKKKKKRKEKNDSCFFFYGNTILLGQCVFWSANVMHLHCAPL